MPEALYFAGVLVLVSPVVFRFPQELRASNPLDVLVKCWEERCSLDDSILVPLGCNLCERFFAFPSSPGWDRKGRGVRSEGSACLPQLWEKAVGRSLIRK